MIWWIVLAAAIVYVIFSIREIGKAELPPSLEEEIKNEEVKKTS
jgi:hypothetical protein